MNKRLGMVVIFALIVSAAASAVVYRMISAQMGLTPKPDSARLLVAAKDLQPGSLITAADIHTVDWNGFIPPRALRKPEDVVGRGVIQALYEGDPMLDTRLAPKGAGGGLAATIPSGMRAAAVKVDEVVGVSGFVVPGMKVDILVSGTPPATGGSAVANKVSKMVLQNIAVLSAGQNMQKDAEGKPVAAQVVNLLVTPEQAELLSLASTETRIQLVLRNPLDTTEVKTSGIALAALFSGGPAEPPPGLSRMAASPRVLKQARLAPVARPVEQPVEKSFVVEVLHGSERTRTQFGAPEIN